MNHNQTLLNTYSHTMLPQEEVKNNTFKAAPNHLTKYTVSLESDTTVHKNIPIRCHLCQI